MHNTGPKVVVRLMAIKERSTPGAADRDADIMEIQDGNKVTVVID